ncbi:GvpL/GvpF family gas vesicle protein [Actinoallomurus rhizosphaericola]|uniref:GvpL/GvpF family gas vesicle protein n=1 Tax=Actinoallomurus rhizosphaericola TaxID=2952536 RepID=UPI0020923F1F|nr:GvpL/GvpF family gas vesicle protein [Actinoallomurus rhizosphaericola]MCO5997188.1 GvpL/GvpF family gas vesicle protein [Actinoallomurus rhizosphaericola]
MTVQYVYGVTDADVEVPGTLTGIDGQEVSLVTHGRCAALVSDLAADRPLGTRDDLMAHQAVLQQVVEAGGTVLPFRFGGALTDRDAVVEELLSPHEDTFVEQLGSLRGQVEVRIKARYVEDAVLREMVQDEPEIAELNQRVRELPEDAAYYDRVRLGELIAQAFTRRRENDGQGLLDALAPRATAVAQRELSREDDVLDAGFLIDRKEREEFEKLVDEVGKEIDGRIRLRFAGPLPPYDFVGQES